LPRLSADADPPESESAVTDQSRRRPIAVTLVGLLAVGVGLYHAADGIVVLTNGGSTSKLAEGAVDLALGVLALAIGRGAFRMARWSWAAFMTWAVIGLTHQLLRHFFYTDVNYLAMAVDAVSVIALTPLDIQIAFGVRPPPKLLLDRGPQDLLGGS
jgi:hypothetical protein